jgi:hypothetical protein
MADLEELNNALKIAKMKNEFVQNAFWALMFTIIFSVKLFNKGNEL